MQNQDKTCTQDPFELETSIPLTHAITYGSEQNKLTIAQVDQRYDFAQYQHNHDMHQVRTMLKTGLDPISCDYIDAFEQNLKHQLSYTQKPLSCSSSAPVQQPEQIKSNQEQLSLQTQEKIQISCQADQSTALLWTNYEQHHFLQDSSLAPSADSVTLNASQPEITLTTNSPWSSQTQLKLCSQPQLKLTGTSSALKIDCYDLSSLPAAVLAKVNGKAILDSGFNTELVQPVYASLFDQSKVYIFEPQQGKSLNSSVDYFVREQALEVGFIRLNQQGKEMEALQGAVDCIREYQPVLVCAIYHTPQAFYELKGFVESLNLGYRFAVRRSFLGQSGGELMLIAY